MVDFEKITKYELVYSKKLEDFNAVGYLLRHVKTKAQVILIDADDDNKTFVIGFRTPMDNSKGVQHILEHSVLCGSEKYPVKDAMMEVGKGSLYSFMNAFTYPDRTLYPVASCNDKDFQNLMSVYLDAVFNPLIYKEPRIFMQEGWHYELESAESDIKINGVVYNEMKGAYSSEDTLINNYILKELFPDNQYGVDSGGNPENIPELSYEEFLDLHRSLYHPSNARIFLYGNMDFNEKLEFIDKEYLSKYDELKIDTAIRLQTSFDKPKDVSYSFPQGKDEKEDKASYVSYSVVVSDFNDTETSDAINVLNYAICSVPGAILKERLIKSGVCRDVYSEYDAEIGQKVFSIIGEGMDSTDKDRFVEIVEDTFRDIINNGFDRKTLEAAITSQEFAYRECDFGSYPAGMVFAMAVFDEWNYSEDNVFKCLDLSNTFDRFRDGVKNGYFENLLRDKILNNNHKVILTLKPDKEISDIKNKELKDRLSAFKASLSDKELKRLIKDTKDLKKFQSKGDSAKALKTIPTLSISDIKKEAPKVFYDSKTEGGVKLGTCEINSNEIVYLNVLLGIDCISDKLYDSLKFLLILLGNVNTANHTYGEMNVLSDIYTGGMSVTIKHFSDFNEFDSVSSYLAVSTKTFNRNIGKTFELIKEILFTFDISDKKRIREVAEEFYTKISSGLKARGDSIAMHKALSYTSGTEKTIDRFTDFETYHFLERLLNNFDAQIDEITASVEELKKALMIKGNLRIFASGNKDGLAIFNDKVKDFIGSFKDGEVSPVERDNSFEALNEGFSSKMGVAFVAAAGNFKSAGLDFTGKLLVLRNILSSEYLWNEVRVKGGAYGCFCGFSRNGSAYFASYRDPNLKRTLDVYKNAYDFVRNFPKNEALASRFAISTIGECFPAPTAKSTGFKAFSMFMTGLTNELLQKDREDILYITSSDIRGLAPYVKAITDSGCVCAVGSDIILDKDRDCLKEIKPLII